jgi:hypothetical protein
MHRYAFFLSFLSFLAVSDSRNKSVRALPRVFLYTLYFSLLVGLLFKSSSAVDWVVVSEFPMGNKTPSAICAPASEVPNSNIANALRNNTRGEEKRWNLYLPQSSISSSIHVHSPSGVGEARVAALLLLVVLRLLLLGLVMVILCLLLLVILRRRRLLLLLLILLMLLLLAVLAVATTTGVLHHRIESLVHASDSSCATRRRAV